MIIKSSELNSQWTWHFASIIDMAFASIVDDSKTYEEQLRMLDFVEFQSSIRELFAAKCIKDWNIAAKKLLPFSTKYGNKRINTYFEKRGAFEEILEDVSRLC